MRIAVIADIHGNAPALSAVLQDVLRWECDHLVHLGDAFNGPIDPAAVATLLRPFPMIHVRGNGERMILAEDPATRTASAQFAHDHLSDDDLDWIESWPRVHRDEVFTAFHAAPHSDVAYLVDDVSPHGRQLRATADITADLVDVATPLVLTAHTHVPHWLQPKPGQWVLNPGSVGLPAYDDTTPCAHRMEVGSPCARYAVVESADTRFWRCLHVSVPYDVETAARMAEDHGAAAWALILRTGYATG